MTNVLYYGDNLDVLRASIITESVDLVYLDPPFNSNANYNILFRSPAGSASQAQIEAFDDTWHWGQESASAFDSVMQSGNTNAADLLRAMRNFLSDNDMMAYLAMMAVRLVEFHRVLKLTGSLYLHCDSTASHYLKLLLDAVFGAACFRTEIVWKRTTAHSNVYKSFGDITDTILLYSKGTHWTWNQLYRLQSASDIQAAFPNVDAEGRHWRSENMRNPSIRPNLHYAYTASNGVTYQPHPNGWTISLEKMRELDRLGKLHFPTRDIGRLRLKFYQDQSDGIKLQNLWDDIPAIGARSGERLGYPTQKPLLLLERIIAGSSNPGDVVLDPFCGCGTTVHAAQKLGRHWIGIDVTHLAISLIERRLKDAFVGISFELHGTPRDLDRARDLARRDKYQFQWWAVSIIDAQPHGGRENGADCGVDGLIYFRSDAKTIERAIVSVKGGDNVGVPMIRDMKCVLDREKAPIGVFLTLVEPTAPMVQEAASAGFYTLGDRRYLRLQIITIEQALRGVRPAIPIEPRDQRKSNGADHIIYKGHSSTVSQ